MVGNTGSGKSTTILKLLGYQLKQEQYKSLPTLVPTQELANAHQTFYTSPEAKSCTRFINAVPIPDAMYPKGTSQNKKSFVICDSPGLGDSAGVEVDIANGVGMINALVGSRSVRVVVLLPYSQITANRAEGLVIISEAIGGIFTDYERSLDCVTVLFNKVPKE
jgi:ABC-type dipeptide/oligopeptide/nickel transport system ATPase component